MLRLMASIMACIDPKSNTPMGVTFWINASHDVGAWGLGGA
jgi:hypothetical protein